MLKLIRFLMEWLANDLWHVSGRNVDYALKTMEDVVDECFKADADKREVRPYDEVKSEDGKVRRDAWSDRQCALLGILKQGPCMPSLEEADEVVRLMREFVRLERRRCGEVIHNLYLQVCDTPGARGGGSLDLIEKAAREIDCDLPK
jgi:hypothetical protein